MENHIFHKKLTPEQLVALNHRGLEELNSGEFTNALDDFMRVQDAADAGIEGIKATANIAKIFEVLHDIPDAIVYAEMAERDYEKQGIALTQEDRNRNFCLLARMNIMGGKMAEAEQMLKTVSPTEDLQDMSEHVLYLRTAYDLSARKQECADCYVEEYIRRLPELMQNMDKIQGANEMLMFLTATGQMDHARAMIEIMEPIIDALDIPSYRMMYYNGKLVFDDFAGDAEMKQRDINKFHQIVQDHMARTIGGILENVKFNLSARLMEKKQEEMEQENARLLEESETDALTGLPNRRALNNRLDVNYSKAIRRGSKLAVEIFDLDYFKQLNDRYGHQKGDEALIAIAGVLKERIGADFHAFRYGGDEFCIIHEGQDLEAMEARSRDLKAAVEALQFPNEDSVVSPYVTISQGIYLFNPSDNVRVWEAMYTADRALYHVKNHDRGGIHITERMAEKA